MGLSDGGSRAGGGLEFSAHLVKLIGIIIFNSNCGLGEARRVDLVFKSVLHFIGRQMGDLH